MAIQNKLCTLPTCTFQNCPHTFHFKPISGSLHFYQTEHYFCPKLNPQRGYHQNTYPALYFNKQPYVDLFTLQIDHTEIIKQDNQLKEAFHDKIRNQMLPKPLILVPHPGDNKTTCHVCKVRYEDYIKHISLKSHKKKIQASRMEYAIQELIVVIEQQNKSVQVETSLLDQPDNLQKMAIQKKNYDSTDTTNSYQDEAIKITKKKSKERALIKPSKKKVNQEKFNVFRSGKQYQDSDQQEEIKKEIQRLCSKNSTQFLQNVVEREVEDVSYFLNNANCQENNRFLESLSYL